MQLRLCRRPIVVLTPPGAGASGSDAEGQMRKVVADALQVRAVAGRVSCTRRARHGSLGDV